MSAACPMQEFSKRIGAVDIHTGVETATKKWGVETLPHLPATSPGLLLLFLEYIMQKGRKNEERNLNAWDRSFVKLDMPHT